MTRAALYTRVSTTGQEDGTSLQTQLDACRQYAADHGYTVVGEYVEVHSGGELWERPQLTALRERVRQRQVDVIVAYALDRLSRAQRHWGVLLDEADRFGVQFEFVTEGFDQTITGTFISNARVYAAEVEREKIRDRTISGKRAKLAAGKPLRAKPAYGYAWDAERGAWAIVEPQAGIVRRVYATLAAGGSLIAIARTLTLEGVPPPGAGRQWWPATLAQIIKNPAYKGQPAAWRFRARKRTLLRRDPADWIPLPADWTPAIVDADTWEQAQRQVAGNQIMAARNNRHANAYLLRGIVYCDSCGRRLHCTYNVADYLYYVCEGHKHPVPICESRTRISARWLDAVVWDDIRAWAATELPAIARRPPDRPAPTNEAQIRRLTRQRDNLVTAIANAAPEALAPLSDRLTQIQREINDLSTALAAPTQTSTVTAARDLWRTLRDAILDEALMSTVAQRRRIALALGITVRVGGPKRYEIDDL